MNPAGAVEIARSVRSGETPATEYVTAAVEAAEASQDRLNAFTSIDGERAVAAAEAIDKRVAAGEQLGPLAGVPVALKDLIDHAGRVTTCGSAFYRAEPERSATVVERLERAGAVVIGRTGLHEFAYGFSSENDWFGPVRNPYDPELSPGGSSGGSGSAVGAGVVPIGIGTDTGGSVRVPAALCGSVGLKVTHGRISLRGVFPLAASIDTVGPITRTASDARLAYEVMRGVDPEDPWSIEPDDADRPPVPLEGLRVAVPGAWLAGAPITAADLAEFERTLIELRGLGAIVERVELPGIVPDANIGALLGAEAAAVHREWFPQLDKRYGPEVEERMAVAMDVSLDRYIDARRWQAGVVGAMRRAFQDHDVLATPAVGHAAKRIGVEEIDIDGNAVFYRFVLSAFSALVNQTWCPAITLPLLRQGTPPPSIQFVAPWWEESLLLDIGAALEQAGVVGHRPPG